MPEFEVLYEIALATRTNINCNTAVGAISDDKVGIMTTRGFWWTCDDITTAGRSFSEWRLVDVSVRRSHTQSTGLASHHTGLMRMFIV